MAEWDIFYGNDGDLWAVDLSSMIAEGGQGAVYKCHDGDTYKPYFRSRRRPSLERPAFGYTAKKVKRPSILAERSTMAAEVKTYSRPSYDNQS